MYYNVLKQPTKATVYGRDDDAHPRPSRPVTITSRCHPSPPPPAPSPVARAPRGARATSRSPRRTRTVPSSARPQETPQCSIVSPLDRARRRPHRPRSSLSSPRSSTTPRDASTRVFSSTCVTKSNARKSRALSPARDASTRLATAPGDVRDVVAASAREVNVANSRARRTDAFTRRRTSNS